MTPSSDHKSNVQSFISTKGTSDLFVTDDNKYSIEFSRIEEYGMMKFFSSVSVWKDKETSELLFQSKHIKFEYQDDESCYYLDKSDIIVLLTPCVHQKYFDLLYVLFDFNKNVFTTINASNFRLTEISQGLIRLDLDFRYSYDEETQKKIATDDGKLTELNLLDWHDIKHIDKTCKF
jgi:hypothetical protein